MQIVSLKLSGSWKKQIKNKKIKPNLEIHKNGKIST